MTSPILPQRVRTAILEMIVAVCPEWQAKKRSSAVHESFNALEQVLREWGAGLLQGGTTAVPSERASNDPS